MRKNVNGPTPHGSSVERIILNYFVRIGDRVEMAVKDDDEGWTTRKVKNGTQGTCIGFSRYTNFVERNCGWDNRPKGEYECNGTPIIRWDSGEFDRPSLHDIVFVDPELRKNGKHNRPDFQSYKEAFETNQYIRPLPDLPFWEWDIVKAVGDDLWDPEEELLISRVSYHDVNKFCDDGVTPFPIYDVTPIREGGGHMCVRPDRIQLVRRGTIWHWYNDKANLKFDSLEDELSLHAALGLREQIKNPKSGNYHWPIEDVLPAAQEGLIDVLVSTGLFGSSTMIAYKFSDPDLSKRCNAKLIEGFEK